MKRAKRKKYGFRDDDRTSKKSIKKVFGIIVLLIAVAGGVLWQQGIVSFPTENNSVNTDDKRTKKEVQEDFKKFCEQVFIDEITDNTITFNYTLRNKKAYGIDDMEPTLGDAGMDDIKQIGE